MPRMTFLKPFDKRLDPVLSVHYQEGCSYDVPDSLVAEITDGGYAQLDGASPPLASDVDPVSQ